MEQHSTIRWVRNRDTEVSSGVRDSIESALNDRLTQVLGSWVGTKYIPAQSSKGVGADCIGFVAGVIDELYKIDVAKLRPIKSTYASIYNGNAHLDLVRFCRRNWPSKLIQGEPLEVSPGDVVVTQVGLGIGHIYIVGPRQNTFWNCVQGPGVACSGMGMVRSVMAAYRLLEKERWV